MTKKLKIILIVVVIILIAGGLFAWKTWSWQGKMGDLRNYVVSLFSGEKEELPADIQAAYDTLKNDPSDTSAYIKIAAWKKDNGKLEDAIKLYESALEVKPDDTLLLMNIAELYTRNEQYAEAAGAYVKVMESDPKWLAAYRSLADLYRYQMPERKIEIPSILKRGLEANSENELYFVGPLAIYYKDFGPEEEAIRWYERLIELDPENTTAKNELEELKK
ncbi:tetratricopeptide repeat protein [Candidatus Falkowbacteria bacterium]|nr:tetratricopeptide repeat protein [Candidatus Falkowbacteria bacterium]